MLNCSYSKHITDPSRKVDQKRNRPKSEVKVPVKVADKGNDIACWN